MADYDLGTAHGQVVITYDGKGSKQAHDDFQKIEKASENVDKKLKAAAKGIIGYFRDIDGGVARTARQFGVLTGGIAILAGLSSATGKFGGALLALRGGSNILGALGTTLGGVPKSVQGFPDVIKKIILLSSAITLVAGSTKLIGGVINSIMRFGSVQRVLVGASAAVTGFAKSFSGLPVIGGIVSAFATNFRTSIFSLIGGLNNAGDNVKKFGSSFDGWGKPIHTVARLALTIGSLIQGVKSTMAVAKYIGAFGAAFAALGGAINIVAGLGSAIKQLSGLLGLLPGAMGAVGLVAATVMVGVKGMGDAFKAVAEGDAAALDEALKKLAPSAREVVLAVKAQKTAWDSMQLKVQQTLFQGLAGIFGELAGGYMPVLEGALVRVAGSLNRAAAETMNYFNSMELVQDVDEGFNFLTTAIDNVTSAFPPLIESFHIIGRVGAEVLAGATQGARGTALAFREWVGEMRSSGKMAEWMRGGIEALKLLGQIAINTGSILKTIFGGLSSGEGASFLLTLRNGTDAMRTFLQSAQGQQALATLRDLLQNSLQKAIALVTTAWREFGPAIMAIMPLITQLGWAFANVLIVAMEILGPIVRSVADALAFLAPVIVPLMTVLFSMGVASKVLSASLMLLIRGFTLVSSAISAVTTVWKVLQFLFLGNPWVALISFIVLLVVLIITNWDTIKTYLAAAWEWISSTAISIWNGIVSFFTGLWDTVSSWWTSTWATISAYLSGVWTTITTTATTIWNGIVAFFTGLWTTISTTAMTIWNGLVAFFSSLWVTIQGVWLAVWTVISTFLSGVWSNIVSVATTIWNGLVTFFQGLWNVILEIFRFTAALLLAIIFTLFGPIIDAIVAIWTYVSDWLTQNWTSIVAFFQGIWQGIIDTWNTIWSFVSTYVTAIWIYITAWLSAKWNEITAIFQAVWAIVVNAWNTIWNTVSGAAIAIWNTIVSYLTGVWNNIVSTATTLWNAVVAVITAVWNRIVGFITPILNTIKTAISTAWTNISTTISGVLQTIWGIIQNVWNNVLNFITGVWSRITSAVSSGVSNVMSTLSNLWSRISGLASTAMNLLVNAGKNIVTGLWNGIAGMGTWLYNQIMGWIRSVVPGPVLQFLGINSPSRWMRDEVGKHLPTGLVEGIKATTGKAVAGARTLAEKVAKATVINKNDIAASGSALAAAMPSGALAAGLSGTELAAARASTANTSATAQQVAEKAGTVVENLVLNIAGNLDPTNPLAWRQGMEKIRAGILQVEKSEK